MPTTPIQTIVDTGADAGLNTVYAQSTQAVPVVSNASVYITNKTEITNNIINQDIAGGTSTEVQFNIGDRLVGDSGFTYDQDTDSLTIAGNIFAGQVRTDVLKYANGSNWVFGGGSYANSNVANYLPVYTGNLTANNIAANTLSGNGYAITFITGANVNGTVASATNATTANSATTAGTVTTAAQPNITSVGTLSALTINGTATATLFSGSGANLTSLNGANVSGTVPSATNATSATTAGTVTTNAQPNITSVGTLSSLSVTANISAGNFIGNGSALSSITGGNVTGQVANSLVSGTVYTASQPNITSLGTLTGLTINGNANVGTTGIVTISNTTQSTNMTSGALRVAGGIASEANIHGNHIHATNNVYAQQTLYAGQNSIAQGVLTNPVIIAKTTGATYVQGAIINASNIGSADWIAYNDEYPGPSDDHGWIDMGMAGSNFNDPLYTITKPHDGYIFSGSTTGTPGGGNLVFATDSTGTVKDIVFATGGFLANNEKFRFVHSSNKLVPYANTTMGLGNTTNYFGNVYADKFIGDGGFLSNITATAAPSSNIINGTSTVDIASSNGNINITANGNTTWTFTNIGTIELANGNGYIQSLPNSAGDGSGLSTLVLAPDDMVGDDRYLIVDPTGPNHVHIRSGGNINTSGADLYLGGEQNYVRVSDSSNLVRMQNQTTQFINSYNFIPSSGYSSAAWQNDGVGGYQIIINDPTANVNAAIVGLNQYSVIDVNDGANNYSLTYTGGSSTPPGGPYAFSVVEAPPSSPTALNSIYIELNQLRTNYAEVAGLDFTVDVYDDVRLTGSDIVALRNRSNNEPVTIVSDYSNNQYTWSFHANSELELPGNVFSLNSFKVGTANSNIQFDQTTGPTSISGKGNVWIYANLAQYMFSDAGDFAAQSPLNITSTGNITLGVAGNANSNVTIANSGITISGSISANNIGNITATNLDGNAANVLLGNGVFSALPTTFTTKLGYSSGTTVTQTTNRGQGVTINSLAGTIVTTSDTIASGDLDIFYVNNNQVDPSTDIVIVQVVSYNPGVYLPIAQPSGTPSNGFYLTIRNVDGFASPTETITLRFTVIKAPNA